jgi:3-hydroxyisobutyrate dehydrogenase-like beta-hydroxyacid dehydrogenase
LFIARNDMAKVAWLGTGLLGSGFVEAMCKRGETVRVWNRTASKAAPLAAHGATPTATPRECVEGVERVHLCLSDDAAVEAVLEAMGPLDPSVPVIDHTTVSPAGARARSARFAREGRVLLGCPVFMGPVNARSANGIMLVAGPAAEVARWRSTLAAMTGKLLEHGEDLGVPAAIKLFGNALIIGVNGVLADALSVASESGVPAADAMQLLQHFDVGNVIKGRGARILEGDFRASFELSMARKDVRLMIEDAHERPLATLPGLAARMDALLEAGHGQDDLAIVAKDAR